MTAAITLAPVCGPATAFAGGENANPAAAGPHAPYATHPNLKETIPMTDTPAHEVTNEERRLAREWAAFIESSKSEWTERIRVAARVILNDIPAPTPPTLADMTPEERSESRWLQCDYGEPGSHQSSGVIGYFDSWEEQAVILTATCGIVWRDYASVTPRPDLPRLEWPNAEGEPRND